mmetsp:Transcript_7288/g.10595  ORF Transcript_7288/g.10595 Transcript_7288/m.10595 type:complete len:175 (+) Transcript_7288:21-545(+)
MVTEKKLRLNFLCKSVFLCFIIFRRAKQYQIKPPSKPEYSFLFVLQRLPSSHCNKLPKRTLQCQNIRQSIKKENEAAKGSKSCLNHCCTSYLFSKKNLFTHRFLFLYRDRAPNLALNLQNVSQTIKKENGAAKGSKSCLNHCCTSYLFSKKKPKFLLEYSNKFLSKKKTSKGTE